MNKIMLLVIVILTVAGELYGGGQQSYFYYDIYGDQIKGTIDYIEETITRQWVDNPDKYTATSTLNYNYLSRGIIIIAEIFTDKVDGTQHEGWAIYYNECFNNEINSDIKLNNNIKLDSFPRNEMKYNLRMRRNEIQIKMEDEMISKKVVLRFDPRSRRLVSKINEIRGINFPIPVIEHYSYEYDNIGRLINVYAHVNKERILRKVIYYDGVLRLIQRPFYKYPDIPNVDEIIIYDDRGLKYRVITRKRHYGKQPMIEWYEHNSFYTILGYDENMNQIEQLSKDYEGKEEGYKINIIEVDNHKNMTHIAYTIVFDYPISNTEEHNIYRKIVYK